jgi:hypothetical protein
VKRTFQELNIWKISALIGLLGTSPVNADTVILSPVDDTYVYSGEMTTNYGSDAVLSSGNAISGNTLQLWSSFLKFDLSSIPDNLTITGAILHMYQVNGAGILISGTDVSHVSNDVWSEATTTYDNRPDVGSVLGSSDDDRTHRDWSQWNLLETGLWDSAADQVDNFLSISVSEAGGNSTHNWCSKESNLTNCLATGETGPIDSLRRPYLEVTYVPLPAAVWLFGTGLLGLVGMAHRTKAA